MKRMLMMIVVSLFVLSVATWAADDPLVGTWKLYLSKSKYNPGPPPKSRVLKFESAANDGLKLTNDGVNAKGEKDHTDESFAQDGKEHKVPDSPDADTRINRRVDANTTETITKKGGQTVQTIRRVVSKDGKTLTITVKGKTPSGAPLDDVRVFDKQ